MKYAYLKVLLYLYPSLPEVASAVKVSAENSALLSYKSKKNTLALAEEIANGIFLASDLEGAYADLTQCIEPLSGEEKFFLEYKYFRRKKILKSYGEYRAECSERGYFRKQNALLKKLGAAFVLRGWTEKKFLSAFGEFAPVRKLYRALREGREESIASKRRTRAIAFRKQQSGVVFDGGELFPAKHEKRYAYGGDT